MLGMASSVCKAKTRPIARFNLSSVLRKRRLSRECEAHFVLGSVRPFFAFSFCTSFPHKALCKTLHMWLITALFSIVQTWRQPRCLSVGGHLPYTVAYFTVLKRSEQATKRPGRALDLVVRDWGAGRDG